MKISFSKKQYEALIKAVFLANGIVHSILDESEGSAFDEIEQHILSHAKDFGLEDYVDHDKEANQCVPSAKLQEDNAVLKYVSRYDDYTFWDKLVFNLARRDMVKEFGAEAVEKMPEEERFVKEQPFAERYEKEFMKNGLKNLTVRVGEQDRQTGMTAWNA